MSDPDATGPLPTDATPESPESSSGSWSGSSPESSPSLGPGRMFGRYLVVERVGAGGVGEVYAAYDPNLDRRVALK
ncbi:MAG: hypothetical protein AAF721_35685, partial [Myxococcota bacterium]